MIPEITDAMIERAAIAICLDCATDGGFTPKAEDFYDCLDDAERNEWRQCARVAFAAAFTAGTPPKAS